MSGIFNANVPSTFQVSGVSPIPAGAIAVTGNVTVVGQTSAGYVSLTPAATPNPKSSTINFPLGDAGANNFTLPLDGSGKLSAVFKANPGKTAHVLVDITGYFVEGDTHGTYATVPHYPRPGQSAPDWGCRTSPRQQPEDPERRRRPRDPGRCGRDHREPDGRSDGTAGRMNIHHAEPDRKILTTSTLNFPVGTCRQRAHGPNEWQRRPSIVYKATYAAARTSCWTSPAAPATQRAACCSLP